MNNEIFQQFAGMADSSQRYKMLGQARATDADDHGLTMARLIDGGSYNGPDADIVFMNARLGINEAHHQSEDLGKRGQAGMNCVDMGRETSQTCQVIANGLI
ncbi:hypothetical protein Kfla_0762 [Kribbella flavida DSM 17836]|uniref:Uncharacterized protein n=1 Tax=Kribbella flavida (strain DSM 17836 / JCM 10339 / NBRC 14399) TaxID=479435 RepID=D2PYN5_KRIFD|nr:hypothetical protein [Kribbella flavida]ADB29881.1 hypothetical protein Kfla_0762 [Kribbella flavida DSM 17836]